MQLRESQLQQVNTCLQQQGILAAWLYGSFSKGTANEHSDIDLALLLPEDKDPQQQLLELDHALGKLTHRTVNCVSITQISNPLAYEAIQGQRLFGETDAMLMEQRIWSKWEDWTYWNK
jgi:predicted nucleotidyltransferase